MSKLKRAIADFKELVHDVSGVPHAFTDSHVAETHRRAMLIGASLVGEDKRRYDSVVSVGMRVVDNIQTRNSTPVVVDSKAVTAGVNVDSDSVLWQDNLESLDYALSAYGLKHKTIGDDAFVVSSIEDSLAPDAVSAALQDKRVIRFVGSSFRAAQRVVANTCLEKQIGASRHHDVALSQQDTELFLALMRESDPMDAKLLYESLGLK